MLLLYENLEINRYVIKNPVKGDQKIVMLTPN